jgi:hypothetical protein
MPGMYRDRNRYRDRDRTLSFDSDPDSDLDDSVQSCNGIAKLLLNSYVSFSAHNMFYSVLPGSLECRFEAMAGAIR